MTDIFREVEEEVRRERFEKLWKLYGHYVLAGLVVLVVAVGGYQLWMRYQQGQREKNSADFQAAVLLAGTGKPLDAAAKFEEISKNGTSGYKLIARLAQADALASAGKMQDAVSAYKMVADDSSNKELSDVARIRAAWIMVEATPQSEVRTVLAPLTDGANVWRFMAREIMAYSDYVNGKPAMAQKAYDALASDNAAPAGVRNRARIMSQFLASGGDADFGTVPPPPKPTTPAAPAGATAAAPGATP